MYKVSRWFFMEIDKNIRKKRLEKNQQGKTNKQKQTTATTTTKAKAKKQKKQKNCNNKKSDTDPLF